MFEKLDDLEVAAFHEAGHAVIGHNLGAPVVGIALDGTQNRDGRFSWRAGNAAIDTDGLGPEQIAMIAYGGPLAEIRIWGHWHANIDREEPAIIKEDIALQLAEVARESPDIDWSSKCLSPTIVVTSTGKEMRFSVTLGNCENDFQQIQHSGAGSNDLVLRTLALINDPAIWTLISRIGKALINSTELPSRKELSGEAVASLLTQ